MASAATPRFVKFILVGLGSTMIHFLVLSALYLGLEVHILPATVLAFVASLVFSYLLNRSFTFSSNVRHHVGLPRYVTVTLLGMTWNVTIMYSFVQLFEFNYYLSFLIMSVVVALNNYLLTRSWVFKKLS
jgi:putative flippase GtrA